jgi:hypothetical protein
MLCAWLMVEIFLRLRHLQAIRGFSRNIHFFEFSGKFIEQMRENIDYIPKTRKS